MFVEEYLQEVRRAGYAPGALGTYGLRLARRVRQDIDAAPGAMRSLWSLALAFFAAAFVAAAGMSLVYDRRLAYDFFLQTALWILPSFALVSLHIGLLRNREGFRLSAVNVPIALTLLRVSLIPGISLFLLERHFALAFATYLFAALSDVADGWLARRWNQITALGTVLDPLVDIVFNLALFSGLIAAQLLPGWVLAVAGLRYGLLLVGGACLYLFVGPLRIQPTVFGRLTGVIMSALVAFLTLLHAMDGAVAEKLVPLTEIALGVLLVVTVAQVLVMGWYNLRLMRGASDAQGRIVGDVRWGAK